MSLVEGIKMTACFMAIIDGTGPSGDNDYDIQLMNSFCSQLKSKLGGKAHYQRGPKWHGANTEQYGQSAANILEVRHKKNKNERLFLAGYSRGGSSALIAAESLQKKGIKVQGVILFDPVAKHAGKKVKILPSNVERSVIIARHEDPEFVKKYRGKINDMGLNFGPAYIDNPIRPGWGITFKNLTNFCSPDHRYHKILASHGALGGDGWTDPGDAVFVEEDVSGQQEAAKYINAALNYWGLTSVSVEVLPGNACFPNTRQTTQVLKKIQKVPDVHQRFRVMPKGI